MQLFVYTCGPDDTQRLAGLLAKHLPPMCFALHGDLGAGKTTFVQGLVQSLSGGDGLRVQSPTFALAKSYDTNPVVHHLDLYRLDDEDACYDLGLADLLEDESCIRCLEWPDRAPSIVSGLQGVSIYFDDEATDRREHHVDLSQVDSTEQEKVLAVLQDAFGDSIRFCASKGFAFAGDLMPTIRLDASLAIAPKVEKGVSAASFEAERSAGGAAVKAVANKVATGELGFWGLPDGKDLANTCIDLAKELSATYKRLVVFGIGGSSLGGRMMRSALAQKDAPEVVFVDNVDPHSLHALFADMDWENTAFNVISKSGGTVETAAQFVLLREKIKAAIGDDGYRAQVVATTDPEKGLLHDIAAEDGLRTLPIPHNVGGRFSVLTAVGLFPAAFMGIDVLEMLDGASSMRSRCLSEDPSENPALMNAMLHTLAEKKGQPIHVMMPYCDRLRPFAEWYGQLWAESLGKCTNQAGQPQVTGPTPVVALGATDQHSQIQLFTEGPADKFFTFLAIEEAELDVSFPTNLPEGYAYLKGHSIAGLLDAERRGTTLALARLGRPSVTLTLPNVSAHAIGELVFLYEAQTAFAGELLDVNAFDQPGVEMGKRIAFGLMGRDGFASDLEGLDELSKVDDAWCA